MTVRGRVLLVRRIVEGGWCVASAAEAAGISVRTAYKWLARYRAGGEAMLTDRSSAPLRRPHAKPVATVAAIEALRRQRMSGPAIAQSLALPSSTVGAILRRLGLGRLETLELPDAAFDLVYSSLAFHYVRDLRRLVRTIHDALVAGGDLVFTTEHPIDMAPEHPRWITDEDGCKTCPVSSYSIEGERRTE